MQSIHERLRTMPANVPLHAVRLGIIAADYVLAAIDETAEPHEPILTIEAQHRVNVVARIIGGAVARIPEDQRDTAHLTEELSSREADVCWLVASGQIDIHTSEVM